MCVGDTIGVELRLTGVSRNGRSAKQLHQALRALDTLARNTIAKALAYSNLDKVQLFCVLMIDGDVETSPGSGKYSSVLESAPVWVGKTPS